MQAFELADLMAQCRRSDQPYLEFLRELACSVGLYMLPAGGIDRQQPHSEDEVYYVVSGQGAIQVAGEDRAVAAGSIIYVAAGVEHRFHSISSDLAILVFFAPAEGSNAEGNNKRPGD
ncbi:MAG: cupin domain-containing protein [Chloroflexales bacterium]|nr:cupin domain-containing protein [Chloroflexales bacterium]